VQVIPEQVELPAERRLEQRGEHLAAFATAREHVDPVIESLAVPSLSDQAGELEILQADLEPFVAATLTAFRDPR
jgi:hypothetical protein